MELTSTCASWRKQRANKEHIQDPVSTTLQARNLVPWSIVQPIMPGNLVESYVLQLTWQRRGGDHFMLQEHQMTLLKCHEDLRHHHQNEKTVLTELQETAFVCT